MEDKKIVALYWDRSEDAISETANKYGRYCHYIAYSILQNDPDSEECVNDTYLRAWNAMPPKRPNSLQTFLGKITRNLSLNRYEMNTREKRGSGQIPLILDELQESVPAVDSVEQIIDDLALCELINRFVGTLSPKARKIFVRRYWYMSSVEEIAAEYGITESNVKVILFRTRNELKALMEKEGISL